MTSIAILGNAPTMTSLELVKFINSQREQEAAHACQPFPSKKFARLEHSDFLKKVPLMLTKDHAGNFSETVYRANPSGGNPIPSPGYRFPKREACQMAMSYSYDLQAKVFDHMTELEEAMRQVAPPPVPAIPQTYAEALRLAADEHEGRLLAESQRDEAIRTKAHIGSKREATAMGKDTATERKQRHRGRQKLEAADVTVVTNESRVTVTDPRGLPQPDGAPEDHPKAQELRDLAQWSEGMVWCSPERHGAMTGIMKSQIDWIPLSVGSVRPTQGKTLAVMEVSGGSQSFNAVNQLRVLGRWMRMLTIPNQSSVAKAFAEFAEDGRMKPSPYYERVVDVMEELVKFTLLTRDCAGYLVDRYSERRESVEALSKRVNLRSL